MTDWVPRSPAPIVPVPAAGRADLLGRRIVIGIPGVGWRSDLRADAAVVQGSRTYVPALPEHEWYRAEVEQTEVFAPLVPVERVWVEVPGPVETPAREAGHDLFSRLVSLDTPPRRDPVPSREVPALTGRRMVWVDGERDRRNLRAVTEPYENSDGDVCVRICPELDWYRWAWAGDAPKSVPVPVFLLWVE